MFEVKPDDTTITPMDLNVAGLTQNYNGNVTWALESIVHFKGVIDVEQVKTHMIKVPAAYHILPAPLHVGTSSSALASRCLWQ